MGHQPLFREVGLRGTPLCWSSPLWTLCPEGFPGSPGLHKSLVFLECQGTPVPPGVHVFMLADQELTSEKDESRFLHAGKWNWFVVPEGTAAPAQPLLQRATWHPGYFHRGAHHGRRS